jgi:thiosulfate/3-mercaptopyruvate sulfurtransferase
LDAGAATDTTLPHMLPSAEKFSADMEALGVGNDHKVICYDASGLFSAARLWWMLKTFGHHNVFVLDGGLPKWERDGLTLEAGAAKTAEVRNFTPALDHSKVKSIVEVSAALSTQSAQLADARSGTRFRGEEPEPRPGVRPGHMPGAKNVHYASLLNAVGTMKSRNELRDVFTSAGIDPNRPIITTCGSGVTAAILSLALAELGSAQNSLYDGSWAEWGASDQTAVTGQL